MLYWPNLLKMSNFYSWYSSYCVQEPDMSNHVLVVDDEESIRHMVKRTLERFGAPSVS